ncbi:MAG: glycosyltransferase family 4 protein, partial [Gammaproteobacteria bacterium]|nr:glycosyltransferase family 4 protein [Gammaproteobacteria bacterium]
ISHLFEYTTSLFFHTVLTLVVLFRHGFDVIHGANPPDIFWLVAAPYKLFGKLYIFDYHDLVPELFRVRFGARLGALQSAILWMERRGLRLADHVIATNDSFRRIALDRGGRAPSEVTVVRNGPWMERDFPIVQPDPDVQGMAPIVVGYLGIMNPQDHLDNLLEAARIIRFDRRRQDIGFMLIGSGDAYPHLLGLRDSMGLDQVVRMPGTLPWQQVLACLSAAQICVQPDLPSEFNIHLTMNKLMEYMALGKATIAYDMLETRVTGGDATIYVQETTATALADAIVELADAPALRAELGATAERRVREVLAWERQRQFLARLYAGLATNYRPTPLSQRRS